MNNRNRCSRDRIEISYWLGVLHLQGWYSMRTLGFDGYLHESTSLFEYDIVYNTSRRAWLCWVSNKEILVPSEERARWNEWL